MKSSNDVRQNSPLSATAVHTRASLEPRSRIMQSLLVLKIAVIVALLFVKYRFFAWRERRLDDKN